MRRLIALASVASAAGCAWLLRQPPQPSPMGGAYPYVQASPTGESPPPHIVAAARENLSTGSQPPACLAAAAPGPSARARCRAPEAASRRVECRADCVRRHLPDEASRASIGGLVALRYTVGSGGRFEDVVALHDPGCGLGAAAPGALRACCEVATEGGAAQTAGADGCYVLTFTTAR